MKLLKQKWNVQKLNRVLIARLIGELEGVSYLLDCLDEEDYNTVRDLLSKYYDYYFLCLKMNELRTIFA
jgi:hypothetical protein